MRTRALPNRLAVGGLLLSLANSAWAAAFADQAQALLQRYNVAGAAIVLIEQGAIAQTLYLGNARLQPDRPVAAETLFQAGSISKPVAAWAVLRLLQEQRLQLDAPVSDYLSRWALPESAFAASGVTVQRLLSHTAGLSVSSYLGFAPERSRPDVVASLNGASNGSGAVRLVAEPGTEFRYSGGGYTVLQLLVEEVTGLPFAEYAQQAVLQPLGMQHSSFAPNAALLEGAAAAHDRRAAEVPSYRFSALAAAGLYTTAADLARFALANSTENPVLTAPTRQLQQRPVVINNAPGPTGLGWFVRSPGLIGHSGSNVGWKAELWFRPTQGDGIVSLTNSESGGAFNDDLLCLWAAAHAIAALESRCARQTEQSQRLDSTKRALMALVAVFSLALVVRLVLAARPHWPQPMLHRAAIVLVALLAIAVTVLFWTPMGGRLISGLPIPLATDNFVPFRMAEAMPYLVATLALATMHLLLARKALKQQP